MTLRIPGEDIDFRAFSRGSTNALVVNFNKRLTNAILSGELHYAKATDNSLGIETNPTDQFIGIVPEVTEPCPTNNPGCTRQTNANNPFISRNGNLVQQAGIFHNGPDLDKGPSTLALDHIFQINGLVDLPWQFQIAGIFRLQSGFHFSQLDGCRGTRTGRYFNSIDCTPGEMFRAPASFNIDIRFSKVSTSPSGSTCRSCRDFNL